MRYVAGDIELIPMHHLPFAAPQHALDAVDPVSNIGPGAHSRMSSKPLGFFQVASLSAIGVGHSGAVRSGELCGAIRLVEAECVNR